MLESSSRKIFSEKLKVVPGESRQVLSPHSIDGYHGDIFQTTISIKGHLFYVL